ncbi:hypothetical protein [Sphingomonas endolithica]|uniref:hypothetical protein n=1 Tax=Sphingomonas endolithica TaxID=2972485 RepID=UPI0021AF46E4|nr:hypothetical protein [Sphingomonas sp. ZFBP2030]
MSADPRLEAAATRTAKLADLLDALADVAASNRLKDGALTIAAAWASETYLKLIEIVDEQR